MDKLVNLIMTKLFQLAEYVCSKCSLSSSEPAAKPIVKKKVDIPHIIHFSEKTKYVQGELFK